MYRINIELDIKAALSSGKFTVARDLLPKIQALNAVRCILEEKGIQKYSFDSVKSQDFFIWVKTFVMFHLRMKISVHLFFRQCAWCGIIVIYLKRNLFHHISHK